MAVNALQASPSASLEEESQGFPAYPEPEIREVSPHYVFPVHEEVAILYGASVRTLAWC